MTALQATATLPVSRERFIPELIWLPTGDGYRAVSRSDDPQAWCDAVAEDDAIVTQVDDGATPPGRLGIRSSSSSSQPSLVAAMLAASDLEAGMCVLEIGTGTGWTAALLSHLLGSDAVTTVEVDPVLAGQARAAMGHAGYTPTVIVGDGAAGYPDRAPYDRVLATCAVGRVPHAWVAQTRPGGQILTPWGTEYGNGALARLTVTDDGSACGRFDPLTMAFMRLRAQRAQACAWDGDGPGEPDLGETTLASEQVYELIAAPGAFAIGLRMPGCHKLVDEDNLIVRIHDPHSRSWARCDVTAGANSHPVAQHGPRRLWDEVEHAYSWWVDCDKPPTDRFGLTVTAAAHHVWLDDPTNTATGITRGSAPGHPR